MRVHVDRTPPLLQLTEHLLTHVLAHILSVHTNPVLLYTTVAVSAVHLLFDVLAFKSDLSFWSSVDSMEGLSSRSLLLNELMELIIFLYLLEEESSWLVKITSVLTLIMGLFKIIKSTTVQKNDRAKAAAKAAANGDGTKDSAPVESLTEEIDRLAFRYLSPPLALLVASYSLYGLYTGYYKSWYSRQHSTCLFLLTPVAERLAL